MDETINRVAEQTTKARELMDEGRRKAREFAQTASERSKEALTYTDQWTHEHVWTALGVAAGIGIMIGLLLAPRSRR